jgi:hypothetical protein
MSSRFELLVRRAVTRIAMAAAVVACAGSTVKADLIGFNPTGGATVGGFNPGTINNVVSFNLAAGDAIAKGSITNGGLQVGSTFTIFYQTVITGFNTTTGAVTPNGLNSAYQLTEISTATETVTSVIGTTAIISLTGGPARTSIYFTDLTAPGALKANPATGLGFVNPNSVLLMTMTPASALSNFTDLTKLPGGPAPQPLNQSGSGGFAGTTTDVGIGNVSLSAGVIPGTYNSSFFVTPGIAGSFFASGINSVFTNVAPSLAFNDPFAPGAPTILAMPGANNGTSGPDFLLQIAAASQSFAVPEPASVAMTLLGFAGVGAGSLVARRRQARA